MAKTIIANPASADRKLTADPRANRCAATYAPQHTCPPVCPFRGSGCYGETGNCGIHTKRLNTAADALPERGRVLALARHEAAAIDALPAADGAPLRLHVVGDCPTAAAARIVAAAARRYRQRGGGPVWTYTHAWRSVPRSAWRGVSVLASVETAADAAAARKRGYAAAAVVAEYSDPPRPVAIGHGITGIPCPAATGSAPDCVRCRLCQRADALHARGRAILLAAHGATKRIRSALPVDAIGTD